MTTLRHAALAIAAIAIAAPLHAAPKWTYGNMAGASLGDGASLNGAVPFPADNAWNTDISKAAVDPNSANLIASIGAATGLHPDFGARYYAGAIIGIPYVVVSGAQANVAIKFTQYGSQSDPGPYPVPPTAPIEGMKKNGKKFGGDRHVLVIDRDTNRLFEMWRSFPQTDASWQAGAAPNSIWTPTMCAPPRSRAGPARTPPACRFSRASRATTKSRPVPFRTRYVLPSRIRARPMCRPPTTGPAATPAPTCRPWACACA
ncbi:MAG: hypothetical protein WDN04_23010 [Rhodospirillales bacterium]